MSQPAWSDLGVGVAAVVANVYIVVMFLRFLGNHLSSLTQALTDATETLSLLRDEVRAQRAELQYMSISAKPSRSRAGS